MVDALDSGSSVLTDVGVRLSPWAPFKNQALSLHWLGAFLLVKITCCQMLPTFSPYLLLHAPIFTNLEESSLSSDSKVTIGDSLTILAALTTVSSTALI